MHGIIDNHAIFTVMERALRRRGFQTLSAYDYGLFTHNIPRAAVRLGEAIEKLGSDRLRRIHVIGHSLGGLIARYYVQRLAGDRRVHTLVTLGTPHHGTQLAWAAPLLPLVRQLTPKSSVIEELAEPAPVSHPLRRVLQRHRPSHRAQPQRPARPSRPQRAEPRSARCRSSLDGQQRSHRFHHC